jgi:hypothetical protein
MELKHSSPHRKREIENDDESDNDFRNDYEVDGCLAEIDLPIPVFQSIDRVPELPRLACRVSPRRVSPLESPGFAYEISDKLNFTPARTFQYSR